MVKRRAASGSTSRQAPPCASSPARNAPSNWSNWRASASSTALTARSWASSDASSGTCSGHLAHLRTHTMTLRIGRRAYAEMFGPTTGDRVRLADTELLIEVERDFTTYGE